MAHRNHAWLYATLVGMAIAILIGCGGRDASERWSSGFEDGAYLAVAEYTQENGVAPFLIIAVEDNAVVEARYGAVDATGEVTDAELPQTAPDHLVETQTLPDLDQEDWFARLAAAIAPRARSGDSRPSLVAIGGTYTAEDAPDGDGWIGRVELTYQGATLREIHYDEIRRDNGTTRKSQDNDYIERWRDATGVDLTVVYERLTAQLGHEGLASGVDIVTGATQTSRRFRTLADTAMNKREAVDFLQLLSLIRD